MRPPAPSRAFWSESRFCPSCKQHRPWFFFYEFQDNRCKPCRRAGVRKNDKKYYAKNREKIIAKSSAQYRAEPKYLNRCRSAFYYLRKRNPKLIPRWVTIESLLPIYQEAERLMQADPDHVYAVSHIYPMGNIKNVCGLHTIDNLRLVKHKKRKGKAFSPSVRS